MYLVAMFILVRTIVGIRQFQLAANGRIGEAVKQDKDLWSNISGPSTWNSLLLSEKLH